MNDTIEYAKEIKKRANDYDDLGDHLNDDQKKKINSETQKLLDYFELNPDASLREIEDKRKEYDDKVGKDIKIAEIESLSDKTKNNLEDKNETLNYLTDEEKNKLKEAIQNTKDFLRYNPNATQKELDEQKKILESIIEPLEKKGKSRKDLSDLYKSLQNRVNDKDDALGSLSSDEKKKIRDAAKELSKWLADNPNSTQEQNEEKLKDFEKRNWWYY